MLFELHCHSAHSDGLASVKEIVAKAKRMQMQHGSFGFALTDHNTTAGVAEAKRLAKKAGVVFIPAVEITCHYGSRVGHVIALGVEEFERGDVFAVLDAIKSSDGVSIIAHPFRGLGYSFYDKQVWRKSDAIEVLNGNTLSFKNMRAYVQAREMKKPMTSGSDAHMLSAFGKYACEIKGETSEEIMKAIKKGKVTIPQKSTNAFRILFYGTYRKSKIKMKKVL